MQVSNLLSSAVGGVDDVAAELAAFEQAALDAENPEPAPAEAARPRALRMVDDE
jgi:hypothetical protein